MLDIILEVSCCIFMLSISILVAIFAIGIAIQLVQEILNNLK